jgi:hypothetical protein
MKGRLGEPSSAQHRRTSGALVEKDKRGPLAATNGDGCLAQTTEQATAAGLPMKPTVPVTQSSH